jgi:hypothetical protein
MIRLRILFAWLLMAAIPLQGFAAASMLFCGKGAQQQGYAATQVAADSTHHDHAMHGHAGGGHHQAKSADTAPAEAPAATSHKCSVCSACCNSMAIIGTGPILAIAPAPQSELAEPLVLIQTLPSPVPDKPPRA